MKLKLSDILDNLAEGEFSQMAWGDSGEISLPVANKIIVLINAGVSDIYKRFYLKRKKLWLQTCPGVNQYVLDSSVANQLAKLKGQCYLLEGDKLIDDVIQIISVHGENGKPFELNVDGDVSPRSRGCSHGHGSACTCHTSQFDTLDVPGTIYTRNPYEPCGHSYADRPEYQNSLWLSSYNTIRVPDNFCAQKLHVTYRAGFRKLKKIEDNGLYAPEQIEVDLPMEYLEPLIYYIASRKFNPNMNGVQQGFHEGNNYYQRYLAACALLVDQGLDVSAIGDSGMKFRDRGFV